MAGVEFNPWFFQDLASLQWGFLSALFDAVASAGGRRAKKVRSTIQKFGRAIAPVGVAGGLVGVDFSGVVRGAADLIGPDLSVERQQTTLHKLLERSPQPVLIVLDDLDRLSPDELLLVFKLIRLVGRLPHVHYLIAYDEETLLDVLGRTGLVGLDQPHRAGAYLEKMIQLRLDVPPLRPSQVDVLIDAALEELVHSIGLQMNQQQQENFAATWQIHIQQQMRTPRIIKRYVAQVEALYSAVSEEVDATDFLLLTWIKVMAPRLFAALPGEKATLTGFVGSVFSAFVIRDQKPQEFTGRWEKLIEDSVIVPGSAASVSGVLGKLFPRYNAIQRGANSFSSETTSPKVIANPDYFDRYFALEVPRDDIPDSVIDAAYRAIVAGASNEHVQRMTAAVRNNTRLAVRKLETRFDQDQDPEAARALLLWLAEQFELIPVDGDLFGPRRNVEGLCVRLYLQLNPTSESIVGVVNAIAELPAGLRLVSLLTGQARTFSFFGAEADIKARQAAYPEGTVRYGELIAQAFAANQDTPPLDLDDDVWSMVWDWRVIDLAEAMRWLSSQYESGRWSRLDTAARLVTSSAPVGTEKWTISDLDLSAAEDLINLDQLIAECERLPPLPPDERVQPGTLATPEARRNYVRTVVDDIVSGRRPRP